MATNVCIENSQAFVDWYKFVDWHCMASRRQTKVAESIAHMAADFFARTANPQSLITVTRADVSPDLKNIKVFFSVLPEKFEESALAFAKRNRTDFREYVKNHSVMRYLPIIYF